MKRILQLTASIILIISMTLILFPSASASTSAPTLVTTAGVNLRSGASTDDGVIRALNPGTSVEVLEHDPAGWSRVRVHGDTGFIRSDLLTLRNGTGFLRTTTDAVRLRASANTDARILKVLEQGTRVEILEHDPAGWSRASSGGVTGFIRSDFLTASANFVAGSRSGTSASTNASASTSSSPTTLMTRAGVNVRSGPSTNHNVVTQLAAGRNVEVVSQSDGWSSVRVGDTTGHIRSDLLVTPGTPIASSATQNMQTTTGVNARSGPSTNHSIVTTLRAGAIVEVLGTANGWSNVRVGNRSDLYIRSNLLTAAIRNPLELGNMTIINSLARSGTIIQVEDIWTGITYNMRVLSGGRHLDVDTLTQADTDAKFRTRNGRWSWDARPVRVTINGRTFAGAINGMPHSVTAVPNNGVNGHFCIHFNGSTSNGGGSANYVARMQAAVAQAWATR